MSFSTNIKNDVTKLDFQREEMISLLSAVIRNIGKVEKDINITTENASLARLIFKIIRDLYDINSLIAIRKNYYFNRSTVYILTITAKIERILTDLTLDKPIPADYLVADEDLKISYLSGCFLASGSVNDPKTSRYHLEFFVDSDEYAKFLSDLLNEFDLNSKYLKRDKGYMVYVKEAEKIADFLRMMKAYNAVLYYEDIRIYRDHKNMTNRLNNCEQANIEKTINTAVKQVKEIEYIMSNASIDLLDEKTKEVCVYRLKYPEASLVELSEIISLETGKKISKSGLNHRFRKIKELYIRLSDKKES